MSMAILTVFCAAAAVVVADLQSDADALIQFCRVVTILHWGMMRA